MAEGGVISKVMKRIFPGRVDVGESRDGRPVEKFDGCLKTLPFGLSEMPDWTALKLDGAEMPDKCQTENARFDGAEMPDLLLPIGPVPALHKEGSGTGTAN